MAWAERGWAVEEVVEWAEKGWAVETVRAELGGLRANRGGVNAQSKQLGGPLSKRYQDRTDHVIKHKTSRLLIPFVKCR